MSFSRDLNSRRDFDGAGDGRAGVLGRFRLYYSDSFLFLLISSQKAVEARNARPRPTHRQIRQKRFIEVATERAPAVEFIFAI